MNFNYDALPAATAKLWRALEHDHLLAGFVLIGGTALALHIGHRKSEDLDLVWTGQRLPRARIEQWITRLKSEGFEPMRVQNIADEEDFLNSGLELLDFQQNFVAGPVKVSLFTPEEELREVLKDVEKSKVGPTVAPLDKIFATKCLVSAHRNKSRDWLDLYVLCTTCGYGVQGIYQTFEKYEKYGWDSAINRLTRMERTPDDEGYEHMMDDPPTLDEMRKFFQDGRATLERALARSRAAMAPAPAQDRAGVAIEPQAGPEPDDDEPHKGHSR